jgi:hypothetical protein
MSKVLGFKNASYDVIYPNEYYSETFVNLLPYDKIVLTTDLSFECNSQNNFNKEYSAYSGTGDIITWISRDIVPFSTINYTNPKLYPKIPEETACLICLSEEEDFYINYNCYDKHNHIYSPLCECIVSV